MVEKLELTMPAVKYGIFIENAFISYVLQALVMFHHFPSDLTTTIAIFVCAQTVLTQMLSTANATKQ